ncbi:MAG: hypothetical protein JWP81_4718 [Ferruginibacter sp.]|nr:hypothetical protein [Ferruginibacter sp.]
MKSILVATILFFSLKAAAQKTEVVNNTKTRAALFTKTLLWIEKNWGDPAKVIESKDETTGMILVKAGLKSTPKTDGFSVKGQTLTEVTMIVENGKATINFAHTIFKWNAGTIWHLEDNNGSAQQEKWKADVVKEINELLTSYKADLQAN